MRTLEKNKKAVKKNAHTGNEKKVSTVGYIIWAIAFAIPIITIPASLIVLLLFFVRSRDVRNPNSEDSYTGKTLTKGERIEYITRISPFPYFIPAIICAILVITIPISFIMLLAYLIGRFANEIAVTNKRVVLKKGIVFRNTEELVCNAIEQARLNQGFLGRIFGYGSITVTGRGINAVEFSAVDDPLELRKAILS